LDLNALIDAVRNHKVRITDHADEEAHADALSMEEILASVAEGEILERYPDDRPYPSCLLLGMTPTGEPVHTVWAYNADSGWAVLVTVYRPDPNRWFDWRRRKPR
jgi:hypothetical protein